jgi:hypothetical protein
LKCIGMAINSEDLKTKKLIGNEFGEMHTAAS